MLKYAVPAALLLASPALAKKTPVIQSVSGITASQTQTITITGTDFGKHKPYAGKDLPIIAVADTTAGWQAGYSPAGDTIKLSVSLWTNTQIVITGFTGKYGPPKNVLNDGDSVTIEVWYAQKKGKGSSSTCSLIVGGGVVTRP
jgi:hypothetical protein